MQMFNVAAQRFSLSSATRGFKTVTVIGGGLMGSGIAQVAVQHGYNVTLMDMDEKIVSKAQMGIQNKLSRVAKKLHPEDENAAKSFLEKCQLNLKTESNLKNAVQGADLVVEAIVEKLSIKQDLFKNLENYTTPECVLVSNTSSLSLSDIGAVLEKKERFAGLHFFQPVAVLRLVEVVRTSSTSEATLKALTEFTQSLDKVPIQCKDTPGFVVNRLLVPYMLEAVRLVERGDASMRDVDLGMKLGASYPMGPFELCDYVGLDTMKFICDSFKAQLPNDATFNSSPLLEQLVAQGKLGRKSGEGFYKYDAQGKVVE